MGSAYHTRSGDDNPLLIWLFPLSQTASKTSLIAMTAKATPPSPPERQFSAPCERNRAPILAVLQRVLPDTGLMVEIAAGTGQHAAYFAPEFPGLTWQPTEPNPIGRASIDAWAAEAYAAKAGAGKTGATNLLAAMDLDVTDPTWPIKEEAAAAYSANMVHIAPWECCLGLMAGTGRTLSDTGVLILYGPFLKDGLHTAPSNAQFDDSLRRRDPAWGIRDLADVILAAADNGLTHFETVEMPANNMMQIFHRRS